MGSFEELEVGLGKVGVEELGVNSVDKVPILDEVTGRNAVFIDELLDFVLSEVDCEEGQSSVQSGDELVVDAVSFPELIVVLKESFHSDLFFPHFPTYYRFNLLNCLLSAIHCRQASN